LRGTRRCRQPAGARRRIATHRAPQRRNWL
jgi:hypothetical protein